ncbi:MAG: AmmeMemoRadiSam system radical SAM enzyme [Thermoprotei archaeon]|nr:MAG: AmmeMemoRadiSam system radical SAM enzyme [Thermoprotei archaeon]
MPEVLARLCKDLGNGTFQCLVCPHRCVIPPGATGICGMRENRGGKLVLLSYGKVSSIGIDPVMKKPLYHFWPNHLTYSIASVGCNFRCPWCQNWPISQTTIKNYSWHLRHMDPELVVEEAKSYGCMSISYTYNEPIIWFEYVVDVAKLAKREGLMNILVTNGYATDEALDELCKYIDAANVDWKAFREEVYSKYIKARLEPVLHATKEMKRRGLHIEITYLIIPTVNDNFDDIRKMCKYIVDELGPDTPLHFSRFYPEYRFLDVEPTPVQVLEKACEIAREEGIKFVYIGNVPGHRYEHTYCPECGKRLIARFGFEILEWNLREDMTCPECGAKIPIVGRYVVPPKRPLYGVF